MGSANEIRDRLFNVLVGETKARLKNYGDDGWFRSDPSEENVLLTPERYLEQGSIYPFAVLYTTPHANNPFFEDDALAEKAFQMGDALKACQNRDGHWLLDSKGKTQILSIAGTEKPSAPAEKDVVLPWTLYHWLQAWMLLSEEMTDSRVSVWRRALESSCNRVSDRIGERDISPFGAWEAVVLSRAGCAFERDEFIDQAEDYMHRLVETQDGEGNWSAWNISGWSAGVHALALYFEFTRDVFVLPGLEKAQKNLASDRPSEFKDGILPVGEASRFVAFSSKELIGGGKQFEQFVEKLGDSGSTADFLAVTDCCIFNRTNANVVET